MTGYDFHPEARLDLDEIWEFIRADDLDAFSAKPTPARMPVLLPQDPCWIGPRRPNCWARGREHRKPGGPHSRPAGEFLIRWVSPKKEEPSVAGGARPGPNFQPP